MRLTDTDPILVGAILGRRDPDSWFQNQEYSAERADLVRTFGEQVVRVYDPDAVRAFLRWKGNERLDTVVNLALDFTDQQLDQLIDVIEKMKAAEAKPPVPGRARAEA